MSRKDDDGKPRCALVLGDFAEALLCVSRVGTYGARKYSDSGWIMVENGIERYTDAGLRHLLAELAGEDYDAESGFLHAAHHAWNALARLELILQQSAALREPQHPPGYTVDCGALLKEFGLSGKV